MFAIHPGETHSNETTFPQGCTYRTLNLDGRLVERLTAHRDYWIQPLICDPATLRAFLDVCRAMRHGDTVLTIESRIMAALGTLIERFGKGRQPTRDGAAPSAVATVRDYLRENHDRKVSLCELAGLVELSPFHLVRSFTQRFGMPPHRYQMQLRLEDAKRLLRQGRSVANVAAECGFADQSHLLRVFKRTFGVTPTEYRGTARTF